MIQSGTRDGLAFLGMDAMAQAELVRQGQVRPIDLVEAAISRCERLQAKLNALASFDAEAARAQALRTAADGVFAGVPTLIKDLLAYPGHPTGFGCRLFLGQRPPANSPYVQALERSGLIVLGKSTASEFGLLGTTESLATGATRNPWNFGLSAGGSSGGSVAAVAAGMVPIAHASDGGGSVRGPASFCGLFGFKPSRGRTLPADIPPDMPTAAIISEHCVSRSVRDSAAWLKMVEPDGLALPLPGVETLRQEAPPRLRIGMFRRNAFGELPSADAIAALETGAAICSRLGHIVVETDGPRFDAAAASNAFFTLTGIMLSGLVEQTARMMGPAFDESLFEPYTRYLIRRARSMPPSALHDAVAALAEAGRTAQAALASFDVLLSPTVPFTAFPLGTATSTQDPEMLMAFTNQLAGYTVVASLAGWPAMSVPLYWSDAGLPLGCHFVARQHSDELLLRLAFQLEAAADWAPRLRELQEGLLCHRD